MKKTRIIFITGVLVMVLQFIGLPNNYRKVLFVILGLILMYCSYYLRLYIISLKTTAASPSIDTFPQSKGIKRVRKPINTNDILNHEILS